MSFSTNEREYIKPSLMVLDVACEAGYHASSGNLTYDKGVCDGWYDL